MTLTQTKVHFQNKVVFLKQDFLVTLCCFSQQGKVSSDSLKRPLWKATSLTLGRVSLTTRRPSLPAPHVKCINPRAC